MDIKEEFDYSSQFIPEELIRVVNEFERSSDMIIGIDPASDNLNTGIVYYIQKNGTYVVDYLSSEIIIEKNKKILPQRVHLYNIKDRINALLD